MKVRTPTPEDASTVHTAIIISKLLGCRLHTPRILLTFRPFYNHSSYGGFGNCKQCLVLLVSQCLPISVLEMRILLVGKAKKPISLLLRTAIRPPFPVVPKNVAERVLPRFLSFLSSFIVDHRWMWMKTWRGML